MLHFAYAWQLLESPPPMFSMLHCQDESTLLKRSLLLPNMEIFLQCQLTLNKVLHQYWSLPRPQTNLDWHQGFKWFFRATTVHSDFFVWPADAWDRDRVRRGMVTPVASELQVADSASSGIGKKPSPRLLMLVRLATWSPFRIITKGTSNAGSGTAV